LTRSARTRTGGGSRRTDHQLDAAVGRAAVFGGVIRHRFLGGSAHRDHLLARHALRHQVLDHGIRPLLRETPVEPRIPARIGVTFYRDLLVLGLLERGGDLVELSRRIWKKGASPYRKQYGSRKRQHQPPGALMDRSDASEILGLFLCQVRISFEACPMFSAQCGFVPVPSDDHLVNVAPRDGDLHPPLGDICGIDGLGRSRILLCGFLGLLQALFSCIDQRAFEHGCRSMEGLIAQCPCVGELSGNA